MQETLLAKLIETIPALAWVVFAGVVYFTIRRPLVLHILPRLTMVRGPGVELTLADDLLDKASENVSGTACSTTAVTASERRGVLGRLDHAASYLQDGRILWVDDVPENNRYLTRLFGEFGMQVDSARSTEEALHLLGHRSYDMVLTDIRRGNDPQAGIRMLQEFRDHGINLPVVIHAAQFDSRLGIDSLAFAGTNRPDEVVHYVIDLMERIRFNR